MGITSSRDTRRISFDNTLALNNTALSVSKTLKDESIISAFDALASNETMTDKMIFAGTNSSKHSIELPEEKETDYWAYRIEDLKKEHQVINQIIETEFEKQIQETNKKYEPHVLTHEKILKVKPCFDWRAKIMQCYEENPRQPLVCSPIVQAFSKCVASCRAQD